MSGTNTKGTSPMAADSKKDNNYQTSDRGSPDSVASDATPVTNNAAVPKKKRNNLHSLWEYRATSLTGKDPDSPPAAAKTTTTVQSEASPRVVSPVVSAKEGNKPGQSDGELAILEKDLDAIDAKNVATNSSTSPNVQPRSVKEEAKKFEAEKNESEDELTLLKKELGTLQGKKLEPKEDTPLQKKKAYQFWEQQTKDTSTVAKNESTSMNKSVSTESPRDDLIVAATATAATEITSAATVAEEGDMPSESKSFDINSISSGDTAQLMSEFRAIIEKLVRKGKLLQLR